MDVRALFELSLLDQSGKGKHKVHNHFYRPLDIGPYSLHYRGSMWIPPLKIYSRKKKNKRGAEVPELVGLNGLAVDHIKAPRGLI